MKPIMVLLLALLAIANTTKAQDLKYELSEPVNISIPGTDKILLMNNGNTVLFHFELRKGIIVKIFDAAHKEIASQKHICNVIDINTLDLAELKAVEAIGDEAVLFITQLIDNRETLVRIRINSKNGNLINEERLVQSESFKDPIKTFVLRQPGVDTYYVVCNKTKAGFIDKEISVKLYDAKHNLVTTIPLILNYKDYDYVEMHNANMDSEGGIAIGVEFGKILQYPDVNKRHLAQYYLYKGNKEFSVNNVELPSNYSGLFTDLTYNPFDKNHNLLLSINEYKKIQYGTIIQDVAYQYHYLMITNDDLTQLKYVGINNSKLHATIGSSLDTAHLFNGNTMFTSTNSNGLSTVVYDGIVQHREIFGLVNNGSYKHMIGITQYNADGTETWSAALPVSRLINYERYPSVFIGLGKRTDENNFRQFGNRYKTVTAIGNSAQMSAGWRQLTRNMGLSDEEDKAPTVGSEANICHVHTIATKKGHYLFYNELNRNLSTQLSGFSDSVYSCKQSVACYSIINKKKSLVKTKLFNDADDEYKQVVAGSGVFDPERNLFVTLIRDRKGKSVTSKIAWIELVP